MQHTGPSSTDPRYPQSESPKLYGQHDVDVAKSKLTWNAKVGMEDIYHITWSVCDFPAFKILDLVHGLLCPRNDRASTEQNMNCVLISPKRSPAKTPWLMEIV